MLDTKEGISLMSLKHNLLLLYLKSLSLISARRAFGHHLSLRSPPSRTISALDRSARGSGAGDLVDGMIEYRVILEKAKTLEARMRYQIDKLVQLAQEPDKRKNITEGRLYPFIETKSLTAVMRRSSGVPTQSAELCR
jgi:U3 small nucleolar ribonucleoprotein protein LCP5